MIKELIDKFYLDKQRDRNREYFYISDTGKCPRAIFFAFKSYPKKPFEPRALRIFDHGDYVHMRIMATLFSLGIVRASEVEIPKKELIHGRADAIVAIDGKLFVVEIKSINRFAFSRLEQPEPEHLKQLQLYLHYFKIPQGILVYECKDTQEMKEFTIEYDEELVTQLLSNFMQLKKSIDSNIMPSVPADIEDWRCRYCEYGEVCKKLQEQQGQEQGGES